MTKQQLIDLIILNLNGGIPIADGKAKYHPAEVLKYIEIVFDDLIRQVCEVGMSKQDLSGLDSFTKPFRDVPVSFDVGRAEYYAVLPVPTMQLQQNLAIRQVSPMKAPTKNFRYTQFSQQVVMSNLDVGQVDKEMKYYVENSNEGQNDHLRFWQGFDPIYDKLLVRMVVPFAHLNDRSETSIPANKALAMVDVIRKLMGDRKGVIPDLTNDNNPSN